MDIAAYIDAIDQQCKEQGALYHQLAVRMGLSEAALCVLYLVVLAPEPLTQQDVCRRACFPKQTVNSAIAGLVGKGYAELQTIAGTRNAKRILLTAAGQELAVRCALPLRQAEMRAYGKLTLDELQCFLQLSAKLNAALREEMDAL